METLEVVALRNAVLEVNSDDEIRERAKAWGDEVPDAAVKAKQMRNETRQTS